MSKIVELNEREIAEVTGGGWAAIWLYLTGGPKEDQTYPISKG